MACCRWWLESSGTEQATAGHTGNFLPGSCCRELSAVPGVQSVSGINHLPLAGDEWGLTFHIEGRPRRASGRRTWSPPTGQYFPAISAPCRFRFCGDGM